MSVCCLLAAVREELETGEIWEVARPQCHVRDEVRYDVAHRARTLKV